MKVLIAGGGTAGHVFPAIALAEELRDRGVDATLVGTSRGLETRLVPDSGFELIAQDVIAFPRKPSWDLMRAPLALRSAIAQLGTTVREHDVVVGMGGYASAPGVLAARRAKVPVVIHEQNAVPGLANRLFAGRARAVAVSFPEAAPRFRASGKCVLTGNPVRRRVAAMDQDALRPQALETFGLEEGRKTLVVFGGSQGALHLDRVVVEAVGEWADHEDLQVLLITGEAHHEAIASALPTDGALIVRSVAFLDRMELAYAVADLVVSRAGATSIAETSACGLPCLLIPYPHATNDHQMANARSVVAAGAAEVMRDDELSPRTFLDRVGALLGDDERLAGMGRAATGRGARGAAAALADLVTSEAS